MNTKELNSLIEQSTTGAKKIIYADNMNQKAKQIARILSTLDMTEKQREEGVYVEAFDVERVLLYHIGGINTVTLTKDSTIVSINHYGTTLIKGENVFHNKDINLYHMRYHHDSGLLWHQFLVNFIIYIKDKLG